MVDPVTLASVELNALNPESVSGVQDITMSWSPTMSLTIGTD